MARLCAAPRKREAWRQVGLAGLLAGLSSRADADPLQVPPRRRQPPHRRAFHGSRTASASLRQAANPDLAEGLRAARALPFPARKVSQNERLDLPARPPPRSCRSASRVAKHCDLRRHDALMDAKRRREVVRGCLFLSLGFIQTTGAVTTAFLYFGLGFHWVKWTSFGVATTAFIASRPVRRLKPFRPERREPAIEDQRAARRQRRLAESIVTTKRESRPLPMRPASPANICPVWMPVFTAERCSEPRSTSV